MAVQAERALQQPPVSREAASSGDGAASDSLAFFNLCLEIPMGRKLYVGNLAYRMTSHDLENLFASHGTVQSAQVIMDRDTGRSKGFGFVEMSSDQEAQDAVTALHGAEIEGRPLTVNEARPREDRASPARLGGDWGGSRGDYGEAERRY
jgi:RNA recognition motif-containing protein